MPAAPQIKSSFRVFVVRALARSWGDRAASATEENMADSRTGPMARTGDAAGWWRRSDLSPLTGLMVDDIDSQGSRPGLYELPPLPRLRRPRPLSPHPAQHPSVCSPGCLSHSLHQLALGRWARWRPQVTMSGLKAGLRTLGCIHQLREHPSVCSPGFSPLRVPLRLHAPHHPPRTTPASHPFVVHASACLRVPLRVHAPLDSPKKAPHPSPLTSRTKQAII
jgi:hypothetical protein